MDKTTRPRIKFSHAYKKLQHVNGQPIKTAKLLLVLSVPQDSFRRAIEFLDYDTDGKYSIPYSTYHIIMIFQKPNGDIFTTVRPQWGQYGDKKVYYDTLVGKEFDIIIEGARS